MYEVCIHEEMPSRDVEPVTLRVNLVGTCQCNDTLQVLCRPLGWSVSVLCFHQYVITARERILCRQP
jgi:hypothetical protein